MTKSTKRKSKKAPQKWHHRARQRVTLTSSTIKAMSEPHTKRVKHWYQDRHLLQKIGVWLAVAVIGWISLSYGISYWYLVKHRNEPLKIGATFIPRYARNLNLEPQQTLDAMINDLELRRFRLVSYWDDIEKTPGQYDFSELDWQFDMIEEVNGEVSLAIGLRQPRWPECHIPKWAAKKPKKEWAADLKVFMGKVIQRYKDRPSLESYQLENEFFMKVFGICPDHTRARLIDEYNFVRKQDPETKLIISRSNNWGGVPLYDPRPDQFGISVYKRVWDQTITKRYFEYPLPPWFYGFLAGAGEIVTGKTLFIHELQAEPWLPSGQNLTTSTLEEQDKSMNPERLTRRIQYAVDTGMRTIDLWGVEWWYYRKIVRNDPSVWEAGKAAIHEQTTAKDQCSSFYAQPVNGRSVKPC